MNNKDGPGFERVRQDRGGEHDRRRVAYMILTHKDPRQVESLAARILELSPHGHVVVHHDLASDDLPWDGHPPPRVHFVERGRVLWGDWSIVEATLRMMRFALQELQAQWFVVLSGEHWPAADLSQWEAVAEASGVDAFVEADQLPARLAFGRSNEGPNMYLSRCVHRWVSVRQPRFFTAQRIIHRLSKLSLYVTPVVAVEYSHRRRDWFFGRPRARHAMRDWDFYKGTQWIGFNARAARVILDTDPAVTEWFRGGHIPDETYFHTVLRHADDLVVTKDVVTYVPVGPVPPTERWMVLRLEELPAVWESGAPFARKVDLAGRPEVIRAMNAEVDRTRAAVGTARRELRGAATTRAGGHRARVEAPACVAVVGMHRSGTSATAGLLVGLGLAGPRPHDLVPASESNERGHWESESVHMTNVRVLAALGGDTYAPPPPVRGWADDAKFDSLRREASQWFASTYDGRPVVLKDPRLCVTLPLWRSALPGRLPTIFVLRDPLEVARSLQARDELPIVLGLALWDRYVRAASMSLEGSSALVVDYAAMLADPVKWTDVVWSYLEDEGVPLAPGARASRSAFLEADLRHQTPDDAEYEPLVGAHHETYAALAAQAGTHSSWRPPDLPPTPPWAEYVLQLRREVVLAKHELYWTQSSRVYQTAEKMWRLTGGGPRPSLDHLGTDDPPR